MQDRATHSSFQVVKDFEKAVADYCGAPYCVAVSSCTAALFLCMMYVKSNYPFYAITTYIECPIHITIPKRTYVSVPMQIIHAGFIPRFIDEDWKGIYQLGPMPIWDCARRFTSNMFSFMEDGLNEYRFVTERAEPSPLFMCTSHHWSKTLGLQQGGCILHNSEAADSWLRKARFDGRTEGVAPSQDRFDMLGWHLYLSPEIAAQGLVRLAHLPRHNADMPNDDYPDLSKLEIFK